MRARKIGVILAIVLWAGGGCTKRRSTTIVHYPDWEYQEYKRVAVLPFQPGKPEAREAARQAELCLVDQLTASEAFHVARRADLQAIMTEQDLSNLAGVADPATALPAGMVQVAQALIIGTLTEFDLRREQKEVRVPRYAVDRKGMVIRDRAGRPVVAREDVFTEYRHAARVGGNVRVVDSATGRVLVSYTSPPLQKDEAHWGSPPRATPEELAVDVAKELATDFCRHIAPQQIQVKLESDCLIVASGYYEGKYEELGKVPRSLPEILLVARGLPRQCDRNLFRLAISPKEGREYLVEHEFTWSPSLGQRGVSVPVPVSKLTDAGGVDFVAKLFSVGNEQPILQREFSLAKPKKVD